MDCQICTNPLTLETVVNTECGHSCCKDCFWRWTKDKNSCPYCRAHLLLNSKEIEEMQHMRELLTHRTEIVRDVETAYTQQERLGRAISNCKRRYNTLSLEVAQKKSELSEISGATCGTYRAMKYLEDKLKKTQSDSSIERQAARITKLLNSLKRLFCDAAERALGGEHGAPINKRLLVILRRRRAARQRRRAARQRRRAERVRESAPAPPTPTPRIVRQDEFPENQIHEPQPLTNIRLPPIINRRDPSFPAIMTQRTFPLRRRAETTIHTDHNFYSFITALDHGPWGSRAGGYIQNLFNITPVANLD